MIPIAQNNTINVIPKTEPSTVLITFQDEFTDETFTITDFTYSNGYLSFVCDFQTIVNRQYTISIVEDGITIFKGKCIGIAQTDQTQTVLMLSDTIGLILNETQGIIL